MFSLVTTIFCLLISSLSTTNAVNNNTSHGGKAIIIDTDIMGDVDDIGALAVANVLHNCGMADLKAVMINTNSSYGSLATSVPRCSQALHFTYLTILLGNKYLLRQRRYTHCSSTPSYKRLLLRRLRLHHQRICFKSREALSQTIERSRRYTRTSRSLSQYPVISSKSIQPHTLPPRV